MSLSKSDRLRIIMDLLIDGDVSDESLYVALDKVDPTLAQKYAQAFWNHYNYSGDSPTGAQLATAVINQLRSIVRDVYLSSESDAAMAQVSAARAAARDEARIEIGGDENL